MLWQIYMEGSELRINTKHQNKVWVYHLITRLKTEPRFEVKALGSAIPNAIASVKIVEGRGYAQIVGIESGIVQSTLSKLPSLCITIERSPNFNEVYERLAPQTLLAS